MFILNRHWLKSTYIEDSDMMKAREGFNHDESKSSLGGRYKFLRERI